jgi:hypothetical protein
MKKFMFLLAFAFVAVSYVAVADAQVASVVINDEEKVEIAPTQLPAPVQETLKGDDYTGWKIVKAFKVLGVDKNVKHYELQVSNEANESKVLKFTESGNPIG